MDLSGERRVPRTRLAMVLLATCVAAALFWVFGMAGSEERHLPAAEVGTMDTGRMEQAGRVASSAPPVTSPGLAGNAMPRVEDRPHDAMEILSQGADATRRRIAELDRTFLATPINHAWARDHKAEIDATIQSDIVEVTGLTPDSYDSSCRDGMCRIEAGFQQSKGVDSWGDFVVGGLAKSFPRTRSLIVDDGSGPATIVLYVIEPRDGAGR